MDFRIFLAILTCCFPATGNADVLTLNDGAEISCEIYKETKSHIYLVVAGATKCRILKRDNVRTIKYQDKDVVNLTKFLETNRKNLSMDEIEDMGVAIEKRSKKKILVAEEPPRKRRTNIRTMKDGVKVLDTTELMVDPFPEEDQKKRNRDASTAKAKDGPKEKQGPDQGKRKEKQP